MQVQQHVRLFSGGEGEQARVSGFAGGGGGALEVGPGAGQPVHVDGLPSGQRGGVGQGPGELLAVPGAQGVPQAGLDLADVGVQLARDGGGAEAAVQEPDVMSSSEWVAMTTMLDCSSSVAIFIRAFFMNSVSPAPNISSINKISGLILVEIANASRTIMPEE